MVKVKSVHSEIGEPILALVYAQWDRPAILICNMAQWMKRVKSVHSGIGQIILALVCEQLDRPALLICNMAQWDGKS